ncbi:hypothetical protein FIU95_18910 [Microbulbifer sp. THAF38]|nr:hypothetical protein FIU95_18910 [Microbulbifer sp. THAF38]
MLSLLVTRVIFVIKEHRRLLEQPGSPTGWLVAQWAKIMVLPQFFLAPFTLLFGRWEGPMIFLARFLAMHVVYYLDRMIPYTRALGICHLVTFGPLFIWFSLNFSEIYQGWGVFGFLFVIEYIIIGLCLYFDLRDLILYLCGRPYPCYVRDYNRTGYLHIEDKRVEQPVTLLSIFFW